MKEKGIFNQPISEIKTTDQIEYVGVIPECLAETFDCDPSLTSVLETILQDYCDDEAIDINDVDVSCLENTGVETPSAFTDITFGQYVIDNICATNASAEATQDQLDILEEDFEQFIEQMYDLDFSCLSVSGDADFLEKFQALIDAVCAPSAELYTFENGITETAGNVVLGGLLTQDTVIDGDTADHSFTFTDIDVFTVSAEQVNLQSEANLNVLAKDIIDVTAGTSAYKRTNIFVEGDDGYFWIGDHETGLAGTISGVLRNTVTLNGTFSLLEMIGSQISITNNSAADDVVGRIWGNDILISATKDVAFTIFGSSISLTDASAAIFGDNVELSNLTSSKTPYIQKLFPNVQLTNDNLLGLDNPFVSLFNHYIKYTNVTMTEGMLIEDGGETGPQVKIGTISDGAGNPELPTSALDVEGDIEVGDADAYYMGDPTTNNSWRIVRSGNNLVFERREAGIWVTKDTITA